MYVMESVMILKLKICLIISHGMTMGKNDVRCVESSFFMMDYSARVVDVDSGLQGVTRLKQMPFIIR